MLIALFPNEKKKLSFDLAKEICQYFSQRKITVVAEDEKAKKIGAQPLSETDPKKIKFLISMGGDGTLLRIAHQFNYIDAPILGINLGHLGFMADVPVQDIFPSLADLLDGKFKIDKRIILEATRSDGKVLQAVNDIVLHRAVNYSLIALLPGLGRAPFGPSDERSVGSYHRGHPGGWRIVLPGILCPSKVRTKGQGVPVFRD